MRTFVAVELPDAVKRSVVARQRRLQQQLHERGIAACVRWTPEDNLHLTLRFLGDTTDGQFEQLTRLFTLAANSVPPFALAVQKLGCFPNFRRPNIVWLDFGGTFTPLLRLQQDIETAAQRAGFAPEARAFTPHLTIGRAHKSAANADLERTGEMLRQLALTTPEGSQTPAQGFAVDHIAFVESDLRQEGPVYTVRAQFPLAG
jgi:RNA 2',3'-cyclic 3'-phosphodiesterase